MINHIDLIRRLQKYRVTREEDMPAAYRKGARPLHDDWPPGARWIPRMWTAYRVPYPFKLVSGNLTPKWIPYQAGYPLVPGTEIREMYYFDGVNNHDKFPHILMYDFIPKVGQSGTLAAWIDGEYRECFFTTCFRIGSRAIQYHHGAKPDSVLGDFMCWYPEGYLHWPKIRPDML